MTYVLTAECMPPAAEGVVDFPAHKTMYGGRKIASGDTVFLFVRGPGGAALTGKAAVLTATAVPPLPDIARQTPRVSVTLRMEAQPVRPLTRTEVARLAASDPAVEELRFKFFRQATPKIGAVSDALAACLDGYV